MNDIDQHKQIARHLAARALVALRANFRVERIVVVDGGEQTSGITCDWTQAREPYRNDMKLIQRGFAFVYVGTIVDQKQTEPLSESISKQLNSDMTSAQEAREAAVQWGACFQSQRHEPICSCRLQARLSIHQSGRSRNRSSR